MLMGKGLYIMPLLFIYHGLLFDQGANQALIGTASGLAALATIAMVGTGQAFGRLGATSRTVLALCAGCILWPEPSAQLAGVAVVCLVIIHNRLAQRDITSFNATKRIK